MQNGNGRGNGKRWLLIGLVVLGGIWLLNDAYEDGYRDALINSGQVTNVRVWRQADGPHFPWGLLILGGIGYVAWRKGAFDRFHGPGGGNGQRGIQPYGGNGAPQPQGPGAPGQGFGQGFRGPRAIFDDWHRQSHQAAAGHFSSPPAPPAGQQPQQAQQAAAPEMPQSPPPPPPAPDYWNTMARPAHDAGPAGAPGAGATPPAAPDAPNSGAAGGPATERW